MGFDIIAIVASRAKEATITANMSLCDIRLLSYNRAVPPVCRKGYLNSLIVNENMKTHRPDLIHIPGIQYMRDERLMSES
jgi:hypothetical protein